MSLAHRSAWISSPEYLELERRSDVRHEYFADERSEMAEACTAYSFIAGNIFTALHAHLAGKRCAPFMNDMPTHIASDDEWYYYPAGLHTYFCETPAIIF